MLKLSCLIFFFFIFVPQGAAVAPKKEEIGTVIREACSRNLPASTGDQQANCRKGACLQYVLFRRSIVQNCLLINAGDAKGPSKDGASCISKSTRELCLDCLAKESHSNTRFQACSN